MTTPNIVKGQIALDPTNDILYYVDESSTIVSTSLSWVKNNSNISTAENVVISGDLTVSGSTVTVNVETLLIEDNIIVLNTGVTGIPSTNAGIEVERGTSNNVQIRWNESTDKWQLTNDGTNFYDILNSSGITGNLTGNVTGNLTGNSAGTHTGAVVGNADTATKLLNARTISLTGPVTGSVSFDGTSNVSITTLLTAESSGISSLSDVTITSVASGDLLKYNGTAWVNTAGYATLASPTFTGTVSGITATMVGLGSVDNTSDTAKPVSTAQQTAIGLKANIASPTFTGTVTIPTGASITAPTGLVKGDVGLGNVDNTSNVTERAATATLTNKTLTSPVINTPTGIVKGDVGLGSVDNTADTAKPVSTVQQTALDLKANIASPTFTGTVSGITKTMVGLGSVDNTADTAKPVSTVQQTALDLKANIASPTFTGTVSGITKTMVGLGSVDNTADTAKPVSTVQQTALDLKANIASPTFTGNVNTSILFVDSIEVDTTGATSGQVLKYNGTKFAPATEIGPTGPTGPAGPATTDASLLVSGTLPDARLSAAIARISSPTFTGTVSGISATMVGLGSVDNTADTAKPVSTVQQTALNLKANIASPTFTGVPSAPTAIAATSTNQIATTAFVVNEIADIVYTPPIYDLDDLGDVTLTTSPAPASGDILKWNGTAWVNDSTLLAAKANLASPTFTGVPAAPTAAASTNTTQVATTAFVRAEVAALVNSAPGTLDTLGEIATSLANNASLSTTLTSSIALKAPLASPTFTGTVTIPSGASISGFALLASPTFTGTVTIPTGSAITLPTVSSGINHSGSTSGTTKLQASDVASGTLTLPAVTGTLVSTGDTGTITSTMIENDTIINADIKSNAGIELGKLADATIDTKTTDYPLVLTDKNKFIKMSVVSSPNTVTVPTNASVQFPIGSQIHIIQYGTGKTQIIPVSGTVTIYSTPGAYLRAQFSSATLLKCDTNIWMLMGDLSAS